MYKYKIAEQEDKAAESQEKRIAAFDTIANRLDNIKKQIRQAKIETIKVYREQPDTFAVVKPTDLINDFLSDIETLLEK
jgi:16S rRNA C967 or C1407 C5-methylase (RsmB/RsmF family)